MWILILTLHMAPSGLTHHAVAIATAEFNDAKACDMARDTWLRAHVPNRTEYKLGTAYCFPKSSTIPERKQ